MSGYAYRRECKDKGRTAANAILSLLPQSAKLKSKEYLRIGANVGIDTTNKGENKMTKKIIDAVKKALSNGTKWTISMCGNDKTISANALRFIPFELFTGLNATQFQDILLRMGGYIRGGETTGDKERDKALIYNGVAIRPMSLIRATYTACAIMRMTKGRPTAKLLKSWTKEAQNAVIETDTIADELKEKQNAINSLKRKSERLALLGYLNKTNEEELNARLAMDTITAEIADLREKLKKAKRNEDEISVNIVKSVWLNEDEDENETKTESK